MFHQDSYPGYVLMKSGSTRPGTFFSNFLESDMQAQTETTTADTDETVSPLETNFGNEKPVVTVPYSSLRPSPLNARTKPLSNVPALAASIRAKGLLQNLVVHELKTAPV